MEEMPGKTQLPPMPSGPPPDEAAFQRGIALGRDYASLAVRRVGAWAEEHPGQMLLAGLAAGFVLGKLLFPGRKQVIEEAD
ncbi:MAG TPA: hypothetical protein VMK66_02325 [Myxococcales bacterium]|nr:hypothetical protein [Myxococcales bacterium]